ncbi:hypothetical protein ACKKBG_A06120 [Auxenochlorella protothecoides x Auxenochlorella symbiontica]
MTLRTRLSGSRELAESSTQSEDGAHGNEPDPGEDAGRLRDKNKKAQARYRAKLRNQRIITYRDHAKTSLDLDAARSENQLLTHTNDLYELVIALRQEAVGVLEALTEPSPEPAGHGIRSRRRIDSTTQLSAGQAAMLHTACSLTCRDAASEEEILAFKHVPIGNLVSAWIELRSRLADALQPAPAAAVSGAGQAANLKELHSILQAGLNFLGRLSCYRPELIPVVMGEGLSPPPETNSTLHWQNVLAALKLNSHQEAELRLTRDRLVEGTCKLHAKRRAILEELGHSIGVAGARSVHEACRISLEVQAGTSVLRATVEAEHRLHHEVSRALLLDTLGPTQQARLLVSAHPFLPDPLMLLDVVQLHGAHPSIHPVTEMSAAA